MAATTIEVELVGARPMLLVLRIGESETDRLVFTELRVGNPDGVSANDLRRIPIGRLEAQINEPEEAARLRDQLARDDGDDAVVAARMATYLDPPSREELQEMMRDLVRVRWESPRRPTKRELRLPRSSATRKPVSFYEAVARVYSVAASYDPKPAAAIAAANDVPVETVYAWIKETRRRGLLASARRTKESS